MYLGFLLAVLVSPQFLWAQLDDEDFIRYQSMKSSRNPYKIRQYYRRPSPPKTFERSLINAFESPEVRVRAESCAPEIRNNKLTLDQTRRSAPSRPLRTELGPGFVELAYPREDQHRPIRIFEPNSEVRFPPDWKGKVPFIHKPLENKRGFGAILKRPGVRYRIVNEGQEIQTKEQPGPLPQNNYTELPNTINRRRLESILKKAGAHLRIVNEGFENRTKGQSDPFPPDWKQPEKNYTELPDSVIRRMFKLDDLLPEALAKWKNELFEKNQEPTSSLPQDAEENENDADSQDEDIVPATRLRFQDEGHGDKAPEKEKDSGASNVLNTSGKKETSATEDNPATEISTSKTFKKKESKKRKRKHHQKTQKTKEPLPIEAPTSTLESLITSESIVGTPNSIAKNNENKNINININKNKNRYDAADDSQEIGTNEDKQKELPKVPEAFMETLREKLAFLSPSTKEKLREILNKSHRRFLYDDVEEEPEADALEDMKPDVTNLDKKLNSNLLPDIPKQISVLTPKGVKIVLQPVQYYNDDFADYYEPMDDHDDGPSLRILGKSLHQRHDDYAD